MISMLLSAAATAIEARLHGSDVVFSGCSTDSRSLAPGALFIALRGERYDGHDFVAAARERGASAALVEEETDTGPLPLLIAPDTRAAMGRLAGHWRSGFDLPLIALTGSNGKTTVKEMISAILSQQAPVLATRGNLNNDIGVPLTLFGLGAEHRYAVMEMGANHPGEIDYLSRLARPTVALITQCAPAHLEGFGSIDGVARAKAEIFNGLLENGTAVINADDDYAGFWSDTASAYRRISFGLGGDADISATNLRFDADSGRQSFVLLTPDGDTEVSLALPGRHNVMNALAAAACCCAVGIPPAAIRDGLEHMAAIAGRLQMKRARSGMRVFDDTYNANPASLKAGLEVVAGYPGRHGLVLGDMGELGGEAAALHRQAGELARAGAVQKLYAIGELSRHAVQAFGDSARHFTDAGELVRAVKADLDPSWTVLVKGSRAMGMEKIVQRLVEEA
jgi:UDP-N-acetylmuramoyl-tripeptide--D-alanyl-D-alanine ligase